MTISDPGPIPPNASPPSPPGISAGALIGGLFLSLCVGGFANIFAGLIGGNTGERFWAFVIGAIPGLLFIVASRVARSNGFAQGLLIGGCIVALVGGACGASMVNLSFQ
jgi:hypothetical protein